MKIEHIEQLRINTTSDPEKRVQVYVALIKDEVDDVIIQLYEELGQLVSDYGLVKKKPVLNVVAPRRHTEYRSTQVVDSFKHKYCVVYKEFDGFERVVYRSSSRKPPIIGNVFDPVLIAVRSWLYNNNDNNHKLVEEETKMVREGKLKAFFRWPTGEEIEIVQEVA